MNGEKGIAVGIPSLVFAMVGVTIIVVLVAYNSGTVVEQTDPIVQNVYDSNVAGEEVFNAPCAMRTRGVFYRSSVVSGDFHCINPPSPVYLNFTDGSEHFSWRVSGGEETTVEYVEQVPSYNQIYSVLVYDDRTGGYDRMSLRVGG